MSNNLKLEFNKLLNPEEEVKEKKKAPKRKSVSKDVRIALNTIRQSLVLVTKSGIDVKTEEEDSEDFYTITVKIPKKEIRKNSCLTNSRSFFTIHHFLHLHNMVFLIN